MTMTKVKNIKKHKIKRKSDSKNRKKKLFQFLLF